MAPVLLTVLFLGAPKAYATLSDVFTNARSTVCTAWSDAAHPDCTQSVQVKGCEVVLTIHTSDRFDEGGDEPCWRTTTETLSFSLKGITGLTLDPDHGSLEIAVPAHLADTGAAPACAPDAGPSDDQLDSIEFKHLGEAGADAVRVLESSSEKCGAKPTVAGLTEKTTTEQ